MHSCWRGLNNVINGQQTFPAFSTPGGSVAVFDGSGDLTQVTLATANCILGATDSFGTPGSIEVGGGNGVSAAISGGVLSIALNSGATPNLAGLNCEGTSAQLTLSSAASHPTVISCPTAAQNTTLTIPDLGIAGASFVLDRSMPTLQSLVGFNVVLGTPITNTIVGHNVVYTAPANTRAAILGWNYYNGSASGAAPYAELVSGGVYTALGPGKFDHHARIVDERRWHGPTVRARTGRVLQHELEPHNRHGHCELPHVPIDVPAVLCTVHARNRQHRRNADHGDGAHHAASAACTRQSRGRSPSGSPTPLRRRRRQLSTRQAAEAPRPRPRPWPAWTSASPPLSGSR